jgi:TatD DNase family protein
LTASRIKRDIARMAAKLQRMEALEVQLRAESMPLPEPTLEEEQELAEPVVAMPTEEEERVLLDLTRPVAMELDSEVSMYIDAHFHLDRTSLKIARGRGAHWTQIAREVLEHAEPATTNLRRCVANFCDYEILEELVADPSILVLLARDPRLYFSFGVHPKEAHRWVETNEQGVATLHRRRIEVLRRLLAEAPKVVGIGELGLDFTAPADQWDVQRKVMTDVLTATADIIHTRQLPVVLHCRDARNPSIKTSELAREVLAQTLGNEHPVQLHFFTGDGSVLDIWQDVETAYFSIPVGVTHRMDQRSLDVLKGVPMHRLLLETDAPYASVRGHPNSPFSIVAVHPAVAKALRCTVPELLAASVRNAERLFPF